MKKWHTILSACLSTLILACDSGPKIGPGTAGPGKPFLKEEEAHYTSDSVNMNGFIFYVDSVTEKRPAVLVVHEWWGNNNYSKGRASQLAALGYVAMAVDMFGEGQIADNPEEAKKLAGPFYSDAQMGKSRLEAALALLKNHPRVDSTKIVAIGYCFGGSMVLNAAKMGMDLDGVVSFHGGLQGPAPEKNTIKAQVLVCHGEADSMVPDQDSATFRKQMDSVGANYQFKSYPNAKHAFTNPAATENGKKFGIDVAYNEAADKNSWNDMMAFLENLFR